MTEQSLKPSLCTCDRTVTRNDFEEPDGSSFVVIDKGPHERDCPFETATDEWLLAHADAIEVSS